MIPKQIFQIYWGPLPIPERYKRFIDTWKKFNPDYEVSIFTKEDVLLSDFILANTVVGTIRILQDENINWVIKVDILKYEILRLFGGFYADLDAECQKSLDCFLNDSEVFGYEDEKKGTVQTSFFGGPAGHPLFLAFLYQTHAKLLARIPTDKDDCLNTSGPYMVSRIVARSGIHVYPSRYFSPAPCGNKEALKQNYPDAYVKHYFYAMDPENERNWIQEFNNNASKRLQEWQGGNGKQIADKDAFPSEAGSGRRAVVTSRGEVHYA